MKNKEIKCKLDKNISEPNETFGLTIKNNEYFFNQATQYRELMMMYNAAIKEVKTKLEILSSELTVKNERNPIESITSRVKSPMSIADKLQRKGKKVCVDEIWENINDVAGIRVICSFVDDIYEIASMLIKQDDIKLIRVKDYIREPKENGYRSLHLLIEIPVFLSNKKQYMRVEVQIRTIAMDFWASLEHDLRYKQNIENENEIAKELQECASVIADTDMRMLNIRDKIRYKEYDENSLKLIGDKMDMEMLK